MTQVGAIGAFEHGPWTLGVTVIHGFGDVNTSRFESGGTSQRAYYARLWGAMAELSYYVALPNNWRFVPRLDLRLAALQHRRIYRDRRHEPDFRLVA